MQLACNPRQITDPPPDHMQVHPSSARKLRLPESFNPEKKEPATLTCQNFQVPVQNIRNRGSPLALAEQLSHLSSALDKGIFAVFQTLPYSASLKNH